MLPFKLKFTPHTYLHAHFHTHSGCYVHSATTNTMHRRTYHLLPNEEEEKALEEVRRESGVEAKAKNNGVVNRAVMKDGTNFFLVLVHYLDTDIASAIQGAEPGDGAKVRPKGTARPRAKKDSSGVLAGGQRQAGQRQQRLTAAAKERQQMQQQQVSVDIIG